MNDDLKNGAIGSFIGVILNGFGLHFVETIIIALFSGAAHVAGVNLYNEFKKRKNEKH